MHLRGMSMAKRDMKRFPDDEYRYWLFDPEGDGMMYFHSKEERDAHGQRCIDEYRSGDGWGGEEDEIEGVCAGEVTHIAKVINKRMRPDDLGADGMDKDGDVWPDGAEWIGRYALEPIEVDNNG